MAANIYNAPTDISNILSQAAVNLRVDDNPPDALACSAWAGGQVDWYCYQRYDPVQLAQSQIVLNWAATLAAFFLCCRRGNGPSKGIAILYEKAESQMQQVQKGTQPIPGIALRRGYAPVMSVMRAHQRPYNRAVVETSLGADLGGKPNYHQHVDPWQAFGIDTSAVLDYAF